jgi:hypothetical protein
LNKDYVKTFIELFLEIEENFRIFLKLNEYKLPLFSFIFSQQVFLNDPTNFEVNLNIMREFMQKKERFSNFLKLVLHKTIKKIRGYQKVHNSKEKLEWKQIAANLSILTKKIVNLASVELDEWCLNSFLTFLNKFFYHKIDASNSKGNYFNKLLSKIGIQEVPEKKNPLFKEIHLIIKRIFVHQLYLSAQMEDWSLISRATEFLVENQKIILFSAQENLDSSFLFVLLNLPKKSFFEFLPFFLSKTSKEAIKKMVFLPEQPNFSPSFSDLLHNKPELIWEHAGFSLIKKKLESIFNFCVLGANLIEKKQVSLKEEDDHRKKREKIVNDRIINYKENGVIIDEEYESRKGLREEDERIGTKRFEKEFKSRGEKKKMVLKLVDRVDGDFKRKLIRIKEIVEIENKICFSPSNSHIGGVFNGWSPLQLKKVSKYNEVNSTNESSIHFSINDEEPTSSNSLENLRLILKFQGIIKKKTKIESYFSIMMLHKHSLKYCVVIFTRKKVRILLNLSL